MVAIMSAKEEGGLGSLLSLDIDGRADEMETEWLLLLAAWLRLREEEENGTFVVRHVRGSEQTAAEVAKRMGVRTLEGLVA